MKTLTLLISAVLFLQGSGYLIKVPTVPIAKPSTTGPSQWVHLQKLMMPLFENVCETSSNPIITRLAQEFNLDSADFLEPDAMTNLQKLISTGLLPRGTIFTEYDPDHMNELRIIFEVLYNAKDFDTFYKTAAWARQNLNCALYVNALYLAILNRRDTERLSIPAPYELLPNYFIDKDVIIKAASIFAGEETTPIESIRYEGNTYTIDANYTALFYDNSDDSKLAYFREDIGLNSYYFLRKLKLAPWFNNDVNGSFGENMYQMMKQFMARYNLERYANGLPEIDSINWDSLIDIPYDPMLIYSDGDEFGHRTLSLNLPETEDIILLRTIENNIVTVVSHMHQSGFNKTHILNHLMEILVTGDRSYETLARKLLGKDLINKSHASVLEHYMTSLRDPMFWRINKKIVDMVDEALKVLPTYTRNELYFPGVEVVNIDVKKMMTACDYFEFDVTDALKLEESKSKFKIKIGQPRLNHKEFTIKVNISSLVSQKGIVKIYLGPKLMPGELAAKKNLFTLLDVFEINLKIGSNIITRSSDNMKHFSDDFMFLETLRKKIEDAEFGLDSLPLKTIQSQVGYPSRLILPKGTPQGLPLQMFVFVAPYVKATLSNSYSRNSVEFNSAILSPGYPLDLMIDDRQLFALPNAMVKYISVTHKSDSKVENYGGPGATKSWYGTDTYDPSARPNYNSKNGQYGGKTDYSVKVNEFNVGTNDIDDENLNNNDDVIGLNVVPNLLKTSKFDYSSQRQIKEPFDYKAKKAEFGKKDYSEKKDFTKYRTQIKVDEDTITSAPIYDILDVTTEKILVKVGSTTEKNNIKITKDVEVPELKMRQNDFLEIETLPQPAMLKKDPEVTETFDYKAKKRERDYKIKIKKIELDNIIKHAKSEEHIKNHPYKTTSEATSIPNTKILNPVDNIGKVILSKDDRFDKEIREDRTLKPVNKARDSVNISSFNTDEEISKVDQRKELIKADKNKLISDMKNKHTEEIIERKDLSKTNIKLDDTIRGDHIEQTEDKATITSNIKNIDTNQYLGGAIPGKQSIELNNQDTKDDFSVENRTKIVDADVPQKTSEEDPIYLLEVIKGRTPSLYDYLMQTLEDDSLKVPK